MEQSLQSETAKLSLVGEHGHAVNVSTPRPEHISIEEMAVRLPAVLQTSLELETVITLFHKEISQVLNYNSLHYQHQAMHCDIKIGTVCHHSCHYRLEINGVWLGEMTLTRRTKFTDNDLQHFEDLLCKLIYPLRNCLLFRQSQTAVLQDALTGLYNRGAFDAHLKREIHLAQRQNTPLSIIVLDIDHFKNINDSYGHSSGDQALKMLANTLTKMLRDSDVAFRYGGEEFALILSNTHYQAARLVAERIRVAISQLCCNDGKHSFGFTVSLGIAALKPEENGSRLFDRADYALYQAKKAGRNQTLCAEDIAAR